MNQKLATLSVFLVLVLTTLLTILLAVWMSPKPVAAAVDGPSAQACTASSTLVTIGNQFANALVGSTSRRAWATIENIPNATNTISLGLNDVRVTTAAPHFVITPATTTSPVPELRFGLNTPFPYDGAIRGITNAGSSTVIVTECLYLPR